MFTLVRKRHLFILKMLNEMDMNRQQIEERASAVSLAVLRLIFILLVSQIQRLGLESQVLQQTTYG